MIEKKKRGRPSGVKTVDIHYKMSKELYNAMPKGENRNKYINDAVKEKMVSDGYILQKDSGTSPD